MRWETLALCLTLSTAAAAQNTPQDDLDAAKKTWSGVWEGPAWHIGDEQPIGGYRLEIAHDTAWKVIVNVITAQTTSGVGTQFKADGNRATWQTALMGAACNASATIDGATLKGETVCGEHGGLRFELTKRQ